LDLQQDFAGTLADRIHARLVEAIAVRRGKHRSSRGRVL
jgi:hypothetical protein